MKCVTGVQQCASAEAVELVSLLGRYEMEGLLYAHDRIADLGSIAPPLSDSDAATDVDGTSVLPAESAFISPYHHPNANANATTTTQMGDKIYKVIRLEKSNEPLVS